MKPTDLYRSVSRATGESVHRLRRMGFHLVVPTAPEPTLPRPSAAGLRALVPANPTPAARTA